MAGTDSDIQQLIASAFSKEELGYLTQEADFQSALEQAETADDLESLCLIGENLLAKRDKAERSEA